VKTRVIYIVNLKEYIESKHRLIQQQMTLIVNLMGLMKILTVILTANMETK